MLCWLLEMYDLFTEWRSTLPVTLRCELVVRWHRYTLHLHLSAVSYTMAHALVWNESRDDKQSRERRGATQPRPYLAHSTQANQPIATVTAAAHLTRSVICIGMRCRYFMSWPHPTSQHPTSQHLIDWPDQIKNTRGSYSTYNAPLA